MSKKKHKDQSGGAQPPYMQMYNTYATPAAIAIGLMALAVGMANGRTQKDTFEQLKLAQQEISENAKQGTQGVAEQTRRAQAELTESIRREIATEVGKIDNRKAVQDKFTSLSSTVEIGNTRLAMFERDFATIAPFVFRTAKEGTTAVIAKDQVVALTAIAARYGYLVETTEMKKVGRSRTPAFAQTDQWVQATVRHAEPPKPPKAAPVKH